MFSHVWSSTTIGVEALPVHVEAHLRRGIPKFTVVGLPNGAVKESRERIYAALVCNELPVPRGVATINLAPANVRKEGTAFDLPMAVALVAAQSSLFDQDELDEFCIIGELALDGCVRPVSGVLSMAMQVRKSRRTNFIVPRDNAAEAAVIDGLNVYGVDHISEALNIIGNPDLFLKVPTTPISKLLDSSSYSADFADVRGQNAVKRALEVAAAGSHNAIMIGPPGSGKTMLARRLPSILPTMTTLESLQTSQIHSVGGRLMEKGGIVTTRPFRSPHHSISDAGLCGGGANPRPGEISLAHNGILFLDELPEFKRQVLEVLRQPLEEGNITISRAQMSVNYPARFMLIAGMNPCPCGNRNNPGRHCICKPDQIQRYLSKISGPLLDRIDIHVEVTPVSFEAMNSLKEEERSSDVKQRVNMARDIQLTRFRKTENCFANAQMNSRMVRRFCSLSRESSMLLKTAVDRLGLSARAFDRILKVARSIADLDNHNAISTRHLSEAIQYRSLDRRLSEFIA